MAYDSGIRENNAMDPAMAAGTNNPGTDPRAEQIVPGTPVFDAAGERMGEVSDAGFTGGLLRIHRFGIFPRDMAVPMERIARTDSGGVYLTVTKEQLDGKSERRGEMAGPTDRATSAQAQPQSSSLASNARERPTDMATDSGSTRADLDVPLERKR